MLWGVVLVFTAFLSFQTIGVSNLVSTGQINFVGRIVDKSACDFNIVDNKFVGTCLDKNHEKDKFAVPLSELKQDNTPVSNYFGQVEMKWLDKNKSVGMLTIYHR